MPSHYLSNNMDTNTTPATKEVQLIDEQRLNQMIQWYDQQISLTAKSKELAVLKSEIAKARAEEIFALAQIAQLTQGPAKDSTQTNDTTTQNSENEVSISLQG